jgi:hypothetical protein
MIKRYNLLIILLFVVCGNMKAVNMSSNDTCDIHILPTNDTTIATNSDETSLQVTTDRQAVLYHWYPSYGISDTSARNPIITVSNGDEGIFYLNAYLEDSNSTNLVPNGDFSNNTTGFSTYLTLSNNLAHSIDL